jgi:hypothetical protein
VLQRACSRARREQEIHVNLPGFGAEAGLSLPRATHRGASSVPDVERETRIFPQAPISFDYCDPWKGCIRTCCTVTIEYVGPYNIPRVTRFCSTQRKPSLECMMGGVFGSVSLF